MADTVGIMQPYCFPYIGYLQLVNRVDTFIFLDDVHFIKKGWIHRNQILQQGKPSLFSIPLREASQNKLILDIFVDPSFPAWREKFFKTLEQSYRKSPQFEHVFPWVKSVFQRSDAPRMTDLAFWSIEATCQYLGITTRLIPSSSVYAVEGLKGPDRIVAICQAEKAVHYINPIGGQTLYEPELFQAAGIRLSFLKSQQVEYPQGKDPFVPWLSILDILFWNDIPEIRTLLQTFDLLSFENSER